MKGGGGQLEPPGKTTLKKPNLIKVKPLNIISRRRIGNRSI